MKIKIISNHLDKDHEYYKQLMSKPYTYHGILYTIMVVMMLLIFYLTIQVHHTASEVEDLLAKLNCNSEITRKEYLGFIKKRRQEKRRKIAEAKRKRKAWIAKRKRRKN